MPGFLSVNIRSLDFAIHNRFHNIAAATSDIILRHNTLSQALKDLLLHRGTMRTLI